MVACTEQFGLCDGALRRWHASISLAIVPTRQCPNNKRVREFSDVMVRSMGMIPGPPTHCTPVRSRSVCCWIPFFGVFFNSEFSTVVVPVPLCLPVALPYRSALSRSSKTMADRMLLLLLSCCVGSQDSTNVLLVRRVDYKAHPRHTGKLEVRIENEEDIHSALVEWADDVPGNGLQDTMS